MSNFTNGGLKISADIPASVAQLNKDLVTIQNKLNNIEVTAKLNDASIQQIQSKLGSVTNNLNVGVNGQYLQQQVSVKLQDAIKKVSSPDINIPFKVNTTDSNDLKKQAEQFISSINSAQVKLVNFSQLTKTMFDPQANKNIEKLTGAVVAYTNAQGALITKTLEYAKIGEYVNPVTKQIQEINGFREVSSKYVQNIEQMENRTKAFSDKVLKEHSALSNRMNEIYGGAIDPNSTKPITNTNSLSQLQKQYKTTTDSIEALKTANADTFANMKVDVDNNIAVLKRLASEFSNIENMENKTKSFSDRVLKESSTLSNRLNEVYNKATDTNSGKPITDTSNLSVLQDQYKITADSIKALKGANSDTFASMKVDVENNISTLRQLVSEISNIESAENKTKSFSDKMLKEYSTLSNRLNEVYNKATDPNAAKPISDATNLSVLQDQYKTTANSIEALKTANADTFTSMKIQVDNNISVLKQLVTEIANAENIASKLKAKPFDVVKQIESNNLDTFITKVENSSVPLDKMKTDLEQLKTTMSGVTNAEGLIAYTNQLSIVESKFRSLSATENVNLSMESVNSDLVVMQSRLDALKLSYDQLKVPTVNLKDTVAQLASEYAKVNSMGDGNEKVQAYQKLNALYQRTSAEISTQVKTQKLQINTQNQSMSLEARKAQILASHSAYYAKHTKLLTSNKEEANKIVFEMKAIDAAIKGAADGNSLTNLTRRFSELNSTVRELGLNGVSFTDKIKAQASSLTTYFSVGTAIYSIVNAFRGGLSTLKSVDTYMTEISKTSDMTSKQLQDYAENAFAVASKYGTTVENFLSATEEMARSGFSGESLQNLAELTILTETAGDVTKDVAEAYILATNAAYQFEGDAERLTSVLDSQNYITNRNSVSMNDMATAMTKAGSIASQTGVRISELSALIGAGVASTKKSGDEVGNALKSIIINFQNLESDKISGTFDRVGISMTKIVNGSKELKTPIELYKELARVFNDVNTNSLDKSAILTNIGGKYQANVLSALLSNYEAYEKMLAEYSQGENSALVEAEKTRQSWTGILNSIKNTWVDFVSGFATDESVTSLLNTVDAMSNGFVSLSKTIGAIPTVVGLTTGLMVLNKVDMSSLIGGFKSANEHIKAYNSTLKLSKQEQEDFLFELSKTNPNLTTYLKNLKGSETSLGGYGKGLVAAKIKTMALTAATATLSAALSVGFSFVISKVISGVTEWANKQKELDESILASAESANETTKNISELASKYNLATLALKNNTGTKESLLSVQDELLKALGVEQSQIDGLIEKYGDLDTAINQVTLDTLRNAKGDLVTAVGTNKNKFIDESDNGRSLDITSLKKEDKEKYEELYNILEKIENLGLYDAGGETAGLTLFHPDSIEDAENNYNALVKAKEAIESIYSATELSENKAYKTINDRVNTLKTSIDKYNSSVSDVNKNQATQDVIVSLTGQDIPKTQKDFDTLKESIIQTAIASENYIGTTEDISDVITNTLSSMPQFSKFFDNSSVAIGKNVNDMADDADAIDSATEKVLDANSSLKAILDDSTISKYVSSFTSGMKTIKSSLGSLDDIAGNATEIANLMTTFPDFGWAKYNLDDTNELKKALNDLADNELKKVQKKLSEYPNANGLSETFGTIVSDIHNFKTQAESLETIYARLTSNAKMVYDANKEFSDSGQLYSNTLINIAKAYPQLEDTVHKYQLGLVKEEELLEELSKAYKKDNETYKKLLEDKVRYNNEYWSNFGKENTDFFKFMKENYDIDLQNCKNLADAKYAIETGLIGELSKAWSDYYSVVVDNVTGLAKIQFNDTQENASNGLNALLDPLGESTFDNSAKNSSLKKAMESVKEYNEVIGKLNGLTEKYNSKDPVSFEVKPSTGGDKDTSVQIDYISNSLENLSSKVKDAQSILTDFENNGSNDYYTDKISAIENLTGALSEMQTGYIDAGAAWKTLYDNQLKAIGDKDIIKKIESGETFEVSTYGEKKGNAIQKALTYRKNYLESMNNATDTGRDITQNERLKNQTLLEQLNVNMSINDLEYENAKTAEQKNALLVTKNGYLKDEYELNLKLATSEEERQRLLLEYNKNVESNDRLASNNLLDEINLKLQINETELENAKTVKDKNALLTEKERLLKEEYKINKSLALTDEERKKNQLEYKKNRANIKDEKEQNRVDAQVQLAELQEDELKNLENQIELRNILNDSDNTEEDYRKLSDKVKGIIALYQQIYNTKKKQLELDIASGKIELFDDDWVKAYEILGGYSSIIDQNTKSLANYNAEAEKVTFTNFEKGIEKLKNVGSELSDFKDMLNSSNFVDDSGNITQDGNTAILLSGKMLANNKAQIAQYGSMIDELNRKYKSGAISQEYYMSKLNEYQSAQRSLVKENISLQSDLANIKIDSINAMTTAYEKQIKLMQDEIDKAEELRKKQKETQKENENIAKLQAKIAKLSSSDSAKDQAAARELQNALNEKLAEKEEKQYEDTAQAKKDALDDSLEKVKEANDAEVDAIKKSSAKQEQITNEMLGTIQTNYTSTMGNIAKIVSDNSLTMTDSLSSIWTNSKTAIQDYITLAQQAMDLKNNFVGKEISNPVDPQEQIKQILQNGNGKGDGSSSLNQSVKSTYGKQLSYEQMAEIANILNLGTNITSVDVKGNKDIKNQILAFLEQLGLVSNLPHFSGGGVVEKFRGNDNGLAWLKTGEGVLNLKEMSVISNLKSVIPQLASVTDSLKNTNLKDNKPVTLDIGSLITVQGDVNDQKALDRAINECKNSVIPIINNYLGQA